MKDRLSRLLAGAMALTLTLTIGVASSGESARAPRGGVDAAMPMTGTPVPGMASFDRVIPELMTKWRVPGGAVAVVKDGRLVLARGYGWADVETHQRVEPASLFRIASLSKSLTAAAILKLIENGRLGLDDKAFSRLDDLAPRPGAKVDPRLNSITIRDLLHHSGGWDSDKSFDPMFRSLAIAREMGVAAPAGAATIVRYMLGKPLQFAPGSRYAYSNFGYCVLGRIIEKTTGQRYEDYVKAHVLRPAGIACMRLGHTLLRERAPGEVRYYGYPGIGLASSVFPHEGAKLPWPYGGWNLEAMDSHGGWIASAVDLARFVDAVDGRRSHPQILTAQSIRTMTARPAPPLWLNSDSWYGMGWQVRPAGGDANWWHGGSLDGTTTIMVRAGNGLTWVALFNSRPKDSDKFGGELDGSLWQAVGGVTHWPPHDLFSKFEGCR